MSLDQEERGDKGGQKAGFFIGEKGRGIYGRAMGKKRRREIYLLSLLDIRGKRRCSPRISSLWDSLLCFFFYFSGIFIYIIFFEGRVCWRNF